MNLLVAFWVSVAIAVGFAVFTVFLLRKPLDTVLVELCGNPGRARFWLVFASVAIVLTALLGSLVAFPLSNRAQWIEYPNLPFVLSAFRLSLFFLLLSLGALAFVLLRGISGYERNRRSSRLAEGGSPWTSGTAPPIRS